MEQWQPIDLIECDFQYQTELQDSLNDYPLGPERVAARPRVMSDKQLEVIRHY